MFVSSRFSLRSFFGVFLGMIVFVALPSLDLHAAQKTINVRFDKLEISSETHTKQGKTGATKIKVTYAINAQDWQRIRANGISAKFKLERKNGSQLQTIKINQRKTTLKFKFSGSMPGLLKVRVSGKSTKAKIGDNALGMDKSKWLNIPTRRKTISSSSFNQNNTSSNTKIVLQPRKKPSKKTQSWNNQPSPPITKPTQKRQNPQARRSVLVHFDKFKLSSPDKIALNVDYSISIDTWKYLKKKGVTPYLALATNGKTFQTYTLNKRSQSFSFTPSVNLPPKIYVRIYGENSRFKIGPNRLGRQQQEWLYLKIKNKKRKSISIYLDRFKISTKGKSKKKTRLSIDYAISDADWRRLRKKGVTPYLAFAANGKIFQTYTLDRQAQKFEFKAKIRNTSTVDVRIYGENKKAIIGQNHLNGQQNDWLKIKINGQDNKAPDIDSMLSSCAKVSLNKSGCTKLAGKIGQNRAAPIFEACAAHTTYSSEFKNCVVKAQGVNTPPKTVNACGEATTYNSELSKCLKTSSGMKRPARVIQSCSKATEYFSELIACVENAKGVKTPHQTVKACGEATTYNSELNKCLKKSRGVDRPADVIRSCAKTTDYFSQLIKCVGKGGPFAK